jgi:hypothetical protein
MIGITNSMGMFYIQTFTVLGLVDNAKSKKEDRRPLSL